MTGTVRVATVGDAEAIANIYAPIVEETHLSFETTPPSTDEIAARIRNTLERFPWIVFEDDGAVVGYSYAGVHNDRPAYQWGADVSVYVSANARREGIARRLYQSLFDLLRGQGYYSVYAVIALPNPPSVALHETLGFEQVGIYEQAGYKCGEWHDVGHWERSIQPRESDPLPPIPFAEFRGSDEMADRLAGG